LVEKPEEIDHFGDLRVGAGIILKYFIKKEYIRMQIGFM
jgi:hypothetical protein